MEQKNSIQCISRSDSNGEHNRADSVKLERRQIGSKTKIRFVAKLSLKVANIQLGKMLQHITFAKFLNSVEQHDRCLDLNASRDGVDQESELCHSLMSRSGLYNHPTVVL